MIKHHSTTSGKCSTMQKKTLSLIYGELVRLFFVFFSSYMHQSIVNTVFLKLSIVHAPQIDQDEFL